MLVLAMDVAVQTQGQDLKEEEVKLLRRCWLLDHRVEGAMLVKEVVVASLFLDFEQNKEKKQPIRTNQQPQLQDKTKLQHPAHNLAPLFPLDTEVPKKRKQSR